MHIASDSLLVGFSNSKTFTLTSMPPTQSFCAKPKTMSQNPSSKNNPRLSGEGGLSQTMGEGRGRDLSPTPHPPLRALSPQGEGYFSLRETVDSATPGKPFVQNDMSVRWEIGRRNQFFKMYSYKRHKMNCPCSISNSCINQKTMHIALINNLWT